MREVLELYAGTIKRIIPSLPTAVFVLGRSAPPERYSVGSPGNDPASYFGRPGSCIDTLATNIFWGWKDPIAQRMAPPLHAYLNVPGNTNYVSEVSALNAGWRTMFGTHDGRPNGRFWGGSLGRAYNAAGVTIWQYFGRGQPKPLVPLQGSFVDYWGKMEWTEEGCLHMNSFRAVKAAGSWLPKLQGTASLVTFVPAYDPPDEIEPVTISNGVGTAFVGDVTVGLSNVTGDDRGLILRIGQSDFLFIGVGYQAELCVDTREWKRPAIERGSFDYFNWTKSAGPLPDTISIDPETGHVKLKMSEENLSEKTLGNYQYVLRIYDASDVQNADAIAGEGKIEVSWTNPEGTRSVLVKRKTETFPMDPSDGVTVFSGSANAYTDTVVENGTTYRYTVFAKSPSGYSKAVSTAQCVATPSDMAPSYVTDFRAMDGGKGRTVLEWSNPSDNGYVVTKVLRKTSSDPQVPAFAIDYTAFPNDPTDGKVVYSGTGTRYVDKGLENGALYYYTAFAIDDTGNYSAPVHPAQDVAKVGVRTKWLRPTALNVISGDMQSADCGSLERDDDERLVIESDSTEKGGLLNATATVPLPKSIDLDKLVKLVVKFQGQNTWNAAKGSFKLKVRDTKAGAMLILFEGAFCDGEDVDRALPLYSDFARYVDENREIRLNLYQNAPAPEPPITRVDLWGVEVEYLE